MVPLHVQLTLRGVIKRLHFPLEIMLVSARWYTAYPLSLRNLEEMMAERGVLVDRGDECEPPIHQGQAKGRRDRHRHAGVREFHGLAHRFIDASPASPPSSNVARIWAFRVGSIVCAHCFVTYKATAQRS